MLLAIDIGNTNTVFGLFDNDELFVDWRSETLKGGDVEQYHEVFEETQLDNVQDVIISSVVPDANAALEEYCLKYIGTKPKFVDHASVGIEVQLKTPSEVGADRLVNAVAVAHYYQTPAVIIDFGTATTFDVVNSSGAYAGGIIAPGIRLSLAALEQAAAKLPNIEIKKPDQAIGKDTREAMQAGIYYGYKGLIEGIVADITAEMGVEPYVIATGGLAHLFGDNMDIIRAVDQSLTMKGLLKIYETQKDKAAA